jgi:hypothetical protein
MRIDLRSLRPRPRLRLPLTVPLTLAALLAFAPPVLAGDHAGRVTLPNGVPVPGARVTASQGSTTLVTTTDAQGAYRFAGIADGTWNIQVEMVGFARQQREVVVTASVPAGAPPAAWQMSVLSFAEITRGVPIPPPAPPRETRRTAPASAAGSSTPFQRAGVAAVPPAGAGTLPPGAAPVPPGAAPRPGGAPLPPIAPPSLGEAADAFLVSGTVNAGGGQPTAGNVPRPTGLRLFRGQISMNGENSAWAASPYSLTGLRQPKPDTSRLSVSGILQSQLRIPGLSGATRNLLVTWNRNSTNGADTLSEFMPTVLQRAGDFSQTLDGFGAPVTLTDPATGLPFVDNRIPLDRISPQAAALLAYYPLPQAGSTGTFNYQIPAYNSTINTGFTASLANIVNNSTNLIGVNGGYTHTSSDRTSLFGFDDETRGGSMNVAVTWTRRFIPSNRQLRLRYTYNRNTNTTEPFFAFQTNVSGDAGITGNDQSPENWGPPRLTFASGIAGLSSGQYAFGRTGSHAFNVEQPRTVGRHNFVIGGNARYQAIDQLSQQNARGGFTFNGSFTGHDFADFLLGLPNTSAIAYGNADKGFEAWNFDAYINDDFRVNQAVTLTLGLRWEFELPVTERFDRLVNLDVADDFSAAAPVVADTGIGPITGREYPASLIRADPWGIQPRIGVAWRPMPTSSVILRAGYGIYRNTSVYQSLAQQMSQQPPLSFAFNSTSTPETPLTLANGFITPVGTTLNTLALDPDFRIGTIHRWQASAQRDLPGGLTVVATYLAGKGINLPQSFIPNTYPVGAVNPCAACPTGFVYTTSGGTSLQNAGQFELRRRQRAGLAWTATYTLTKATDNASSFTGTGGNIAQDWLDLDAEHAASSFEQRHQFRFNVNYNTGTGADGGGLRRGLLGRLVNNWAMTANVTSGSGTPRTPVYLVRTVAGVSGTVRASLTGLPIDEAPDGFYANPAAFTAPAPGTWGDAPRNSIRGPAQFALGANLSRNFLSGSRFQFSWGIDATNLLNTVVYTGINTTVGSQQFGLPTSVGGMRRISTRMNMGF